MRFYTRAHKHYRGIDLHARTMYLCILDAQGEILLRRNFKAEPAAFLKAVAPYRDELVVAVECIFTWYWLADLCAEEGIAFVLGHALYMKAIHGGKAKNDRIDAHKIAMLLRGGMLPQAYVYPKAIGDARSAAPAQSSDAQALRAPRPYSKHREPVQPAAARHTGRPQSGARDHPAHFPDAVVRRSVELDLSLIAHYDELLGNLERQLALMAKAHDAFTYHLLRSIPGVGRILPLVLLYELEDIGRFPGCRSFCPTRGS